MKQKQKRRAFTKCVKVRRKAYKWLLENKGVYSIAGKLDEVINFYRDAKRDLL